MKKITTPHEPAHHIAVFQETTIRRVWHNEEWWFAIVDVVGVLTDSADPRQYIKKMRSRDPELDANWGTTCTPLALQAADGKQRATNCANTKGLDVVKTGNKRVSAAISSRVGTYSYRRPEARSLRACPLSTNRYRLSTFSRAQGVLRRKFKLELTLGSCEKQRIGIWRANSSQP